MGSLAALLLAFAGAALLYQADARRTQLVRLRTSRRWRDGARAVGGAALVAALVLAAAPQGFERGVPVFFGLLTVGFVGTLLLAALRPGWHPSAGSAALVLGGVLAMGAAL